MTELDERIGVRIVGLLLVVAAAAVVGLWTLDTSVVSGESLYAIYVSIDLICFSMIAYIYRKTKVGDSFGRIPMLAGCFMLALLVVAGLAVI